MVTLQLEYLYMMALILLRMSSTVGWDEHNQDSGW